MAIIYNSTFLRTFCSLASSKSKLDSALWLRLITLGISRVKPTRRGTRGGLNCKLKIPQSSLPSESCSTSSYWTVPGENPRKVSFNQTNLPSTTSSTLNIQIDTSIPGDRNNGFIPVITPSFQSRRQYCERSTKHRNTHNLIKINRTSLAPSVQPCKAINFSLLNMRSLKAALVNNFIVDNKIDILTLTETC